MARKWLTVSVVVAVLVAWSEAFAVIIENSPQVEIWTDRGEGAVYRDGERVDIYIRPEYDCYVIVYGIDTEGYLRVLYPYDCYDDGYVVGGRVRRIGGDAYRRCYVTGPQGIEYVHVVASPRPFRRLYWHGCSGYDTYAHDVSWSGFQDYWGCALPPRIYGDPFIAMQTIDEFICLDALDAGDVLVDFTYFYVHDRVSYPRYLCYDCHGFNTHVRPYVSVCTGFSITLIDCDPCYRPWSWWWWCSPKRVYCGPRYVCNSRKTCKTYPSQYKWKTRDECRSDGYASVRPPVKAKQGNIIDGARVKTSQKSRDLDLYSRREPGGVTKSKSARPEQSERARVTTTPAKIERVKSDDQRGEYTSPTKTRQVAPKGTDTPKAPASVREPSTRQKTKESTAAKVLKSLRKVVKRSEPAAKSTKSGKASKTKVAPKVRTKDQGRSPATRRRVSR